MVHVLILLPPSETKADGGDGPPLDLDALSFPELRATRDGLVSDLATLSRDEPRALTALDLSPRQASELTRNVDLRTAPTRAAIDRYTGVLYDALDAGSLRGTARARALDRLAVGSALFGVVRAGDAIPAYRLSAGSRLPGLGTLAALWRPRLQPVLVAIARTQLVVDLRSGAYRALAPIPGAITVDVLSQRADGSRSVVSHANKATKGRVARLLASTSGEPSRVADVTRVLRRGGLLVERAGDDRLDVILDA